MQDQLLGDRILPTVASVDSDLVVISPKLGMDTDLAAGSGTALFGHHVIANRAEPQLSKALQKVAGTPMIRPDLDISRPHTD